MFTPIEGFQLALRLGCAMIVGIIIGWEREDQGKAAGLRTHILVCFGSALVILVPIQTGAIQQSIEVFGRVIQPTFRR